VGFLAAVFNNGIDCVQNVFSKKLLSTHYNYVNLQVRARARG
jgi:solute carrier family 35 protein E2|tara:strand:+ start:246 stop:371 length:126 start_codon:yes stop_codon:yes gene_type:complete